MSTEAPRPSMPLEETSNAHMNALYVLSALGFDYDQNTGHVRVQGLEGQIDGSVGEVMASEEFYVPQIRTEQDRINTAFEIGFLLGRRKDQNNG